MKALHSVKCILQITNRCSMSSMAASNKLAPAPEPAETEPMENPDISKNIFLYQDLHVERCQQWQMQPKPIHSDQLKFGHHFADHMMEVDWSQDDGWTKPMISPIHEIMIHPGSKVLHYAIELFEGMKAYRGVDNRIRLFRPYANMARMKRTAMRSSLPDFDAEELMQIICELVRLDKEWVPYSANASLYIRPTLIATDPTLGVAHPRNAKLFVLSGPVGAFFSTGFKPVSLFADSAFVRAFPGGVGSFKMGCNYAPTILLGRVAAEFGCQQVLWLSGDDHKLTEVGAMNIFVFWRNEQGDLELVTPPLIDGLILPGVTRDSVLTIAREWDEFRVVERYPTMDELKKAVAEGRMLQMFGSGTACAVSPVGRIVYKHEDRIEELVIPTMSSDVDVMQRFYDTIVGIQQGREDRPEWVHIVC